MKKINRHFVVCFLLLLSSMVLWRAPVFAQKQTTPYTQLWLGYFNQTRFSDHWGVWGDFQLRTKDHFFDSLSVSIVRVGVTYYVKDLTKITAGYAYVTSYPEGNHALISQPEHRFWQQVQWHSNYPRLRLMQWFRLEERFRRKILNAGELADGYNFNYRVRYNFWLSVPLSAKAFAPGTLAAVVNDELHVNFGKEITYNYFDQNRFFIGFAWQLSKASNLQFGYTNVFQQLAAGNQYKSINGVRIFFFQNLDLRRPKP